MRGGAAVEPGGHRLGVGWTVEDKEALEAEYKDDVYVSQAKAEELSVRLDCKPTPSQVYNWFHAKRRSRGDETAAQLRVGWTPADNAVLEEEYKVDAYITMAAAAALAGRLESTATAEQVYKWFTIKRKVRRDTKPGKRARSELSKPKAPRSGKAARAKEAAPAVAVASEEPSPEATALAACEDDVADVPS